MSSTRGPAAAAGCGCAQSNVPRFSSFCRSRSIFRSAPRASPVRGETSSATAGRGGTPGCLNRRRWCCRGHAEAGSRRRRVRRPSARLAALGRWVIFYCSFPCQRHSGFFAELLCAPPVGPEAQLDLPPSGNHNAQPPANRAAKDRPCAQRPHGFEPPVGKATDLMIRNGQRKLLTCRSIASTAPETSG